MPKRCAVQRSYFSAAVSFLITGPLLHISTHLQRSAAEERQEGAHRHSAFTFSHLAFPLPPKAAFRPLHVCLGKVFEMIHFELLLGPPWGGA